MERYAMGSRIGSGSYGTVHRVRDRWDDRVYWMKRIDLAASDEKQRRAAYSEVAMLMDLDHPGIVRYHDHFVQELHLCVVMDYCESGDLHHAIKRRARGATHFAEEEVLDLFMQILDVLSYVHSQRVLHRDLKTHNIFLNGPGRAMLGDFGIAKQLEGSAEATGTATSRTCCPSAASCTSCAACAPPSTAETPCCGSLRESTQQKLGLLLAQLAQPSLESQSWKGKEATTRSPRAPKAPSFGILPSALTHTYPPVIIIIIIISPNHQRGSVEAV